MSTQSAADPAKPADTVKPADTNKPSDPLVFVIGAVMIAGILSVLVARAPFQIRLFFLFPIGIGLLIGWLLTNLADRLNIKKSGGVLVVVALATLASLTAGLFQSIEIYQPPRTGKIETHPIAELVWSKVGETLKEPSYLDRLQAYLSLRLDKNGRWVSPWPEAFWMAETLCAVIASVIAADRCRLRGIPA